MKPRSYSEKKSDVLRNVRHFFGKSPTFLGKSPTFWGANAGQKEESRGALGEKMGGFEGKVTPLFQTFNQLKIAVMCDLC